MSDDNFDAILQALKSGQNPTPPSNDNSKIVNQYRDIKTIEKYRKVWKSGYDAGYKKGWDDGWALGITEPI